MATETTLKDALDYLEQERDISRDAIFAAIEDSLMKACKKLFLSTENITYSVSTEKQIKNSRAGRKSIRLILLKMTM